MDDVALREQEGRPLAQFVVREFEGFLGCGDIRRGSATMACTRCGFQQEFPFSCKRRGWCPHCMVHRLWDRSTFLHDQVLGDTPIRDWVQTLPPPLRFAAAFDPSLTTEILTCHLESIFQHLRWKAKSVLGLSSVTQAHPGAVTVIQRCSTNLALNCHFHCLVTDGVFVQSTPDGPVTFHELPPPTDKEIAEVAWETCRRTRELLVRRGVWQDIPDEAQPASRPTVTGILTLGPGGPRKARFCGAAARHEVEETVLRGGAHPFDLWAQQRVRGGDSKKLAKIIRYILNPPFTDDQLSATSTG